MRLGGKFRSSECRSRLAERAANRHLAIDDVNLMSVHAVCEHVEQLVEAVEVMPVHGATLELIPDLFAKDRIVAADVREGQKVNGAESAYAKNPLDLEKQIIDI